MKLQKSELYTNLIHQLNQPGETANLGKESTVSNIPALNTATGDTDEFYAFRDYKTVYPPEVIDSIRSVLSRYNTVFTDLVTQSKEKDTDYQQGFRESRTGQERFVNVGIQLDMRGIPQQILDQLPNLSPEEREQFIANSIFEIENSLARVNLLSGLFSENGSGSRFRRGIRGGFDRVRQTTNADLAMLAVTQEKYEAIKAEEFGLRPEEKLTARHAQEVSGYDWLFGPEEYIDYLEQNGGPGNFVVYARTSAPVSLLRKPNKKDEFDTPTILADHDLRTALRAAAVTPNVDNPDLPWDSPQRINDTKAYMEAMGLGITISDIEELSEPRVMEFLADRGIDPDRANLRIKPLHTSYGCYGHETVPIDKDGFVPDKKSRGRVRKSIRDRGPHIVQPEMPTSMVTHNQSGQSFKYIDRNFFTMHGPDPENIEFIGGFRNMIPDHSNEAQNNRIHGNEEARWAEIISE